MSDTKGDHVSTRPSAERPTTAEELTNLLRPPSTEDGPLFTSVWREVAAQPSR